MHEYFQSLQKVIEISPRVVMPSHGISLGGTNKVQATLKHRLEREEQVSNCLKEGKGKLEILSTIYPELPTRLHKYALETIDSHLEKLEKFGAGTK